MYEAGYITLSSTKTQARQVAFLVLAELSLASLDTFFMDMWEERVERPVSRAEQERLERRLRTFCEESFCGKREDWTVSVHTQLSSE